MRFIYIIIIYIVGWYEFTGVVRVMAVGQTYLVKHRMSLFSQDVYNVFYYQQSAVSSGGANDSEALCNAVMDRIYASQAPVSSSQLVFVGVEAFCLSNPLDWFNTLYDPGTLGLVGGECEPPFTAWGFIYKRETRASRNGAKRFAGVPEVQQINGQPVAGAIPLLETLANTLANTLTSISYAGGWEPKIYSRLTASINAVADVQFQRITTQNTRKFGRGS